MQKRQPLSVVPFPAESHTPALNPDVSVSEHNIEQLMVQSFEHSIQDP